MILVFAGCFSPYQGESGTITINFGNSSGARGAVWPDSANGEPGEFHHIEHRITLTGPSGTITRIVKGGDTVRISVAPGLWEIQIEDFCYGELFALGSSEQPFEVKAGQNEPISIKMLRASHATFYTVGNSEWNSFSDWLFSSEYFLILTEDIEAFGYSSTNNTFNSVNGVTIIGNGHKITLSSADTGSLFTINGGEVRIKDVRLIGHSDNDAALVTVNGGKFIMESGSISGNTNNSTVTEGGGVAIGNNGSFEMTGGTISKNKSTMTGGGGVSVNGTFTMNGGTISGNETSSSGGGVYVGGVGIFRMINGIIENNTGASGSGSLFVNTGTPANNVTYGRAPNGTDGGTFSSTDAAIRVINGQLR